MNYKDCFFEISQRNFRWDSGLFSVLVKNKKGMKRAHTNLKDSDIPLQMSWLPRLRTADMHSSERWIGDS